MNISTKAEARLKKLLPPEAVGFSVADFIGTCRGSTPAIQPAQSAQPGQKTLLCEGLTFFLNPEIAEHFSTCNLDYDPSFLGKGLTASWPQCKECNCHS
jgi:Fe-S cluster assembly iron-binding protein IscA